MIEYGFTYFVKILQESLLIFVYQSGKDNMQGSGGMDISFTSAKLAKLCSSDRKLRGEYGPRMAGLIQQRLSDLSAAETLEVMRALPGRCHELTQNFKGCLAVDLVHPDRLVFAPDHDPLPTKEDGGLDWSKVSRITIVGIGDYH